MSELPEPPGPGTLSGAAFFRPVRAGNAFEETVERLLQVIKLGVVAHGERLPPQRELAERFHVSRVTLREALGSLEQAGYVRSRRGRTGGTFVTHRPGAQDGPLGRMARRAPDEVEDTLAYRRALEIGAAELAAGRALGAQERRHLADRLRDTQTCEAVDYRRTDSRFHLAIAELSGSRSLAASIADTRMRLNDLLNAIPLLERNIEHSQAQHARLVAAILAGDPVGARQAAEEHLAATASLLRGFLG
ncbi:putative GntR family transcriptional regulator [Actinacidiphila reveromycinica]|uniref:Putative GntR family transcriptional regulator n=1 Tax=Actinacidiphila reveromycinica TaxID=659352 RepID=A0A7U3VLR3_9ACTN|nr:GntR family transcriptional regulator [Streptomyces sp. SN-593]BBA95803.1 putative GntR family transcriptional regulator [Streptomyces sp. SN-593]